MHVLLPAEACQRNYSALKGAGQVVQLASSVLWDSGLEERYTIVWYTVTQSSSKGGRLDLNWRPSLTTRDQVLALERHIAQQIHTHNSTAVIF